MAVFEVRNSQSKDLVFRIPQCDNCDEFWLPRKGKNREDPAKYVGRCGKCKSPRWNDGPRDKRLRGKKIKPIGNPEDLTAGSITEEVMKEAIKGLRLDRTRLGKFSSGRRPKLCIHGRTGCPECHGAGSDGA